MAQLTTEKPRSDEGWYWADDMDGARFGPFATRADAAQDMWDDGRGEELYEELCHDLPKDERPTKDEFLADFDYIDKMGRPAINTDMFSADFVLEEFEERNQEAVWDEVPPVWPSDAKRELELMLADALYRWVDKHGLWKQFRALW